MDTKVNFREADQQRLRRRLKAVGKNQISAANVDALVKGDLGVLKSKPRPVKRAVAALVDDDVVPGQLEKMVGESLDLVPAWYLDEARRAANAVCRIIRQDRKPEGTGVLVASGVLLTNHHVIPDAASAAGFLAQFNYELDANNQPIAPTEFELDPSAFFWTSPAHELDTTLIAVGQHASGDTSKSFESFGVCPLSAADDKHAAGDFVTVVQHPNGDFKQVALRENRVIGRGMGGVTLHYTSDTLPGSSGSPVFNDDFDLVAIHHAGGPRLENTLDTDNAVPSDSNEGIRVSRIVAQLSAAAVPSDGGQAEKLRLILGDSPTQPATEP